MAGDSYRRRFLSLTLEEKVRVAAYARSMGFRITCFGEEIEGLKPVELLGAESYQGSYPPLGYATSMSENEKAAAALAKWMCTTEQEELRIAYGYPVERIANELEASPVDELIPGIEAVLGKTPISGLNGWLACFNR